MIKYVTENKVLLILGCVIRYQDQHGCNVEFFFSTLITKLGTSKSTGTNPGSRHDSPEVLTVSFCHSWITQVPPLLPHSSCTIG